MKLYSPRQNLLRVAKTELYRQLTEFIQQSPQNPNVQQMRIIHDNEVKRYDCKVDSEFSFDSLISKMNRAHIDFCERECYFETLCLEFAIELLFGSNEPVTQFQAVWGSAMLSKNRTLRSDGLAPPKQLFNPYRLFISSLRPTKTTYTYGTPS